MATVLDTNYIGGDGLVVHPVLCNTAKDGTGTWYIALLDSDGHLQVDALSIAAGTNAIGKLAANSGVDIGDVDVLSTAITKTIQTELLAITAVAADTIQKSSELSLTNVKEVSILIDHGRTATTAFVAKGTQYIVEVSQKATGNDTWVPLLTMEADITAAIGTTADAGEGASGDQVILCGASPNYPAIDDFVFWENATLGLSEWGRVVARNVGVGTESFTLEDPLTNTQAVATLIYNMAHRWAWTFNVKAYTRLRVVVNNAGGTTNVAIKARVAAITET